jgi:hypothetical protein
MQAAEAPTKMNFNYFLGFSIASFGLGLTITAITIMVTTTAATAHDPRKFYTFPDNCVVNPLNDD